MKRIICLSSVDYDWMFQRPQQLMKELSNRGWEVIYCNKTTSKNLYLDKKSEGLTICHNIKQLLAGGITADILWIVDPKLVTLKGAFKERLTIYDCVDDFPLLKLQQHRMLKAADIVITTSKLLCLDLKKYKKEVHLVQNGCDIGYFDNNKQLATGWRPPIAGGRVIGYIGALASWVDIGLIKELAAAYQNDNILMVGANIGYPRLPKAKNISYVGQQSYNMVPAYLNMMDATLIPFKQNQITRATNPIKMYEYLSLGKPIISSLIPEVVPYKDVIYISKNKEEFIKNVRLALEENSTMLQEKRRKAALNNSWRARVDDIEEIIKPPIKKGRSR